MDFENRPDTQEERRRREIITISDVVEQLKRMWMKMKWAYTVCYRFKCACECLCLDVCLYLVRRIYSVVGLCSFNMHLKCIWSDTEKERSHQRSLHKKYQSNEARMKQEIKKNNIMKPIHRERIVYTLGGRMFDANCALCWLPSINKSQIVNARARARTPERVQVFCLFVCRALLLLLLFVRIIIVRSSINDKTVVVVVVVAERNLIDSNFNCDHVALKPLNKYDDVASMNFDP